MQSRYVTEQTLQDAIPEPEPEEEEDYEGEFYEDELYEDDDLDEEFEDEQEPEEEHHQPEEEDADVRVARLRRLNKQFVGKDDLEVPEPDEDLPFELEEGEGPPQVLCTKCGSANDATDSVCANCGARLPRMAKMDDRQQFAPGSVDVTLKKFYSAVESFRIDDWSVEELWDWLDEMLVKMRERSNVIIDFAEFTNYIEWSPTEMQVVIEGMNEWEAAVAEMIDCLHHEEFDHLETLLEVMKASNDKLLEGLRLNREFRQSCAGKLNFDL